MGDTSIIYSDKFGINTFKREICIALGETFWNELVEGITLPDIGTECKCQCRNMQVFMKRLEEKVDAETVKRILYKVRHGLHPSQSAWAREKFLEIGDGGFSMASKDFVSKLPFPIVPIDLQNEFATFVEQTDKLKFEVKEALEKLETLKKSLMQQYFG